MPIFESGGCGKRVTEGFVQDLAAYMSGAKKRLEEMRREWYRMQDVVEEAKREVEVFDSEIRSIEVDLRYLKEDLVNEEGESRRDQERWIEQKEERLDSLKWKREAPAKRYEAYRAKEQELKAEIKGAEQVLGTR